MKKKILSIATLMLLLGVVSVNNTNKTNCLEVRDILLEDTNKVGNKVHKKVNEVAQYKISNVKAQVNESYVDNEGNNRIDIRFVAGIDSYNYTNAKYNIIVKDGESIVKNIEREVNYVYEKVEANNDILTASQAFGEDYNYMIAYTIKAIPETAWGYNFEVTATLADETREVTSNVVVKNIEAIKEVEDLESPYLYLYGPATPSGGWDNSYKMPLVLEDPLTYEVTADFNAGDFIATKVQSRGDTKGLKLKPESGNFNISIAGNYTFTITKQNMSGVEGWGQTRNQNNGNAYSEYYYKLTPNFEIDDQPIVIENLYLNGGTVGGWETYVQLEKLNDTTFSIQTTLSNSTQGFVITAQKSRNSGDIVLKPYNIEEDSFANYIIDTTGLYIVTISLENPNDPTYTILKDEKGNYDDLVYIKVEVFVETRENVALTAIEAVASTFKGSSTANKVIDGQTGGSSNNSAYRWESEYSDPQWIKLDLGASYRISGITVKWYRNANAKTYKIFATDDENIYNNFVTGIDGEKVNEYMTLLGDPVVDVENKAGSTNRVDTNDFEEVTARYIILVGIARTSSYGYSIDELEVHGIR